jgi:hypothetical protein
LAVAAVGFVALMDVDFSAIVPPASAGSPKIFEISRGSLSRAISKLTRQVVVNQA